MPAEAVLARNWSFGIGLRAGFELVELINRWLHVVTIRMLGVLLSAVVKHHHFGYNWLLLYKLRILNRIGP